MRVFSDEQRMPPCGSSDAVPGAPRSGLGGAGRWWWDGKPAVSMPAQASLVSGVTSRGCPLLGGLEHNALAAFMKDQGDIWVTPALTPNTSRRKLFQDFIVLMVKALISGQF